MCITFAEHVSTFGRECDPAACVLPRLEQLLRHRMRRKNLISGPPAHLGYDAPSWDVPGAFEDIVVDCYVFAVARRIVGLRNQLQTHANLDGFITRNVDNFLTSRQRRRDPIGYAVFGNVEGAVAPLIASGQLSVDELESGRLRGASLLCLDPTRPRMPPADPAQLRAAVADAPGWTEVLAELISTTDAAQRWIADLLRRLRAVGVECVRVADLVSAIAARARADWGTRHATPASELGYEGDGELRALVRLVQPDESTQLADRLDLLRRLIPERIAHERQQRVRDKLTAVFREWLALIEEDGFARPNQAELAERVGVPDATLSDHLRRLREMIAKLLPENPET